MDDAVNDNDILPGWTTGRVIEATLVVLAVALSFWLLYRLYSVVFTLFIAIVISLAIRPLVDLLSQHGLPRWLGVGLVLTASLLVLAAFFVIAAPVVAHQAQMLANRLPQYYDQLRNWLVTSGSILLSQLGSRLPSNLASMAPPPGSRTPGLGAMGQAMALATGIGRTLFTLIAILILAFYWALEGEWIIRSAMLRLPMERRSWVSDLLASVQEKVGAYVRAQALLSLIVGTGICVACLLIGLPYALLLGVLAAIFEAVPVVGAVLACLFPLLVAFTQAPGDVIWVALAVLIVQESEAHLLAPRIMNKAVGVHPIVTILALTGLASFFGLSGAILAVPMAAIIQLLLDRLVLSQTPLEVHQIEGRGQLSALRHSARELAEDARKHMRDHGIVTSDVASDRADRLEDVIESIAIDLDSILALQEQEGKQ